MRNKTYNEQAIQALPDRERVNFVNSMSGFKSANLIGTRSANGVNNLAVVSSVFHVGANPPLIGLLMRPHTVVRDTLENIKRTGVYTINHIHSGIVEQAHQCSARYAPEVSEFDEVGLTPQLSAVVNAPFVAESYIKIALEVQQITKIELNATELVIGKIVEIELPSNIVLNDGFVDIEAADSVAVSCLDSYHTTQRLARYSYAKPKQVLSKIENK